MSVLKHLRSLSEMEFYKNAIRIRKDLTVWMLKDFGAKRNPKSVKQVIKNISEDDQKVIDDIFLKYGKTSNHQYQSEYPSWFVNYERKIISTILTNMIHCITKANSIYPSKEFEWDLRRKYQDIAITQCYALYQELQYIVSLFPTDLNRFCYLLEDIEKEIALLKGWRQSDNNVKNKRNKKG